MGIGFNLGKKAEGIITPRLLTFLLVAAIIVIAVFVITLLPNFLDNVPDFKDAENKIEYDGRESINDPEMIIYRIEDGLKEGTLNSYGHDLILRYDGGKWRYKVLKNGLFNSNGAELPWIDAEKRRSNELNNALLKGIEVDNAEEGLAKILRYVISNDYEFRVSVSTDINSFEGSNERVYSSGGYGELLDLNGFIIRLNQLTRFLQNEDSVKNQDENILGPVNPEIEDLLKRFSLILQDAANGGFRTTVFNFEESKLSLRVYNNKIGYPSGECSGEAEIGCLCVCDSIGCDGEKKCEAYAFNVEIYSTDEFTTPGKFKRLSSMSFGTGNSLFTACKEGSFVVLESFDDPSTSYCGSKLF